MVSIVAISMKTESGDDYLSLYTDIKDSEHFVSRVKEEMGDEFAYVYDFSICTDDSTEEALEEALYKKINEVQDND